MGIYLNPGNEMFQEALNSEIYVDKSGLIACTNAVLKTRDKYVCVSRPRRFGKSMAIDMLAAYYCRSCDSRSQFADLEIAGDPTFATHLNRYDVIKLTVTSFLTRAGRNVRGAIELIEDVLKEELAAAYPSANVRDALPLSMWLERVYASSGVPFVILVDEWDCVMREVQGDEESQREYLDWLRDLLKDAPYIALAYATGILPVKKYGAHSALNMFAEISMLDAREYARFTGFTAGEVEALCARYDMDLAEVRRWYDGYDVDGVPTFNPRSVVMSMTGRRFGNYWTQTESFEALRRYIVLDMGGLHGKVVRLVAGDELLVNAATFQNDMTTFSTADDVLTLLVHLGYLTYDAGARTVRVPNSEVGQEFANAMQVDDGWKPVVDAIAESEALLKATIGGEAERVADLIGKAHRENASVLRYNDENSLACVLSIAYYAARRDYRIEREAPSGKGFADLVFWPRPGRSAPALVVELKAGGSADEALRQIRSRGYGKVLAEHPGALAVGIAYDPNPKSDAYKEHDCIIAPIATLTSKAG